MKQDIYGNRAITELRMPDIKVYLSETAGKCIELSGFKYNKSSFSFKRKHGKDYEEIFFTFYNGYPLYYRAHFSLLSWNTKMQSIKKEFPYQQNIDNFEFCTVFIPMGDFIDEEAIKAQVKKWTGLIYDPSKNEFVRDGVVHEITNLTWAQIAGYAYELYDSKDLFEAAEEMKKLLEEQVLPLVNQLSTIDGIDTFFAGRPGWSVKSLSLNNFASELIAAKLNGKRDYHEVFKQIAGEIDKRIISAGMSQETRKVVEELYKYLQSL